MNELAHRLSAVLDASPELEVLVVDNSPEGALTMPDQRIRVERCALPGLSRARSAGCRAAEGSVLVFTDDDVDFPPEWPMRMAAPLLDDEADAAAAPVRLGPEFDHLRSRLAREWLAEANLDPPVRLVGAGMAIHRRMLTFGAWDERLGAGRPDFAFGEESLFELMIRESGARIVLVPDAGVIHHPDPARTTNDHFLRIARQKGLSDAYIGYHWRAQSLRMPRLRQWRRSLRLFWYRLVRPRRGDLDEHELRLVESIGLAKGYALLAAEPRAYVPRRPIESA